jgi:sec-independent protein translocase protein TatB
MEFLGIGAPELIFIVIIALILLGPKDMQKAGKTIGVWLNNLVRSDWWRAFRRTSDELRRLPTNLMREANREMMDIERDLRKDLEPPSIAGPRAPVPSAPASPVPPPKAQTQPEPRVNNPPDAGLNPEPPAGNPPDAEVKPEKKPIKPPDQQED